MEEILIPSQNDIPLAVTLLLQKTKNTPILCFYGSMGVGKTTIIKELMKQIGVADTVTSPSFSIVNEYRTDNGSVYHFDLYRLTHIQELLDIGIEEYFYSGGLCCIEWPEIAEPLLPESYLSIKIEEQADGTRKIIL